MDGNAPRKPKARPAPPARKQSLQALDGSYLDEEDTFDETLLSPSTTPQVDSAFRRTQSERANHTPARSPLGGQKMLSSLNGPGQNSPTRRRTAPRAPGGSQLPSPSSSVSSPSDATRDPITSPGGSAHSSPTHPTTTPEDAPSKNPRAQPVPTKRARSRDNSPSRAGADSTVSSPTASLSTTYTQPSRPKPVLQLPGPPRAPAPHSGKSSSSRTAKTMASPQGPEDGTSSEELKAALQDALAKAAAAEEKLQAQTTKHKTELQGLREEISKLQEEKNSDSDVDCSQQVIQLRTKVAELQSAARRCTALEKKLAAAEELSSLAEEEAQETRDEAATLRQQLGETQQRLKTASIPRPSKSDDERHKALETEIGALKEQVEGLEGEKALVLADYDSIAAEVATLRATSASHAEQNATLQTQASASAEALARAKQSADSQRQELSDLQVHLDEKQKELATAEGTIRTLSQKTSDSSQQEKLVARLQGEILSKDALIKENQVDMEALSQKVITLQSDLDVSTKSLEDKHSKVTSLQSDLAQRETSISCLGDEVSSLNEKLLTETNRCNELDTQVMCLQQEKSSLADQLKQLKPLSISKLAPDSKPAVRTNGTGGQEARAPTPTDTTTALSVTPVLSRDESSNLSVGEVTKNEEVNKVDAGVHPAQPQADSVNNSNRSSPASIRSNASGGTPPVVAPYSVHKKRTSISSRESTPETSPDTPRKDEKSAWRRSQSEEANPSIATAAVAAGTEAPGANFRTHSFVKTHASSGAAALAAVMSGIPGKHAPSKDTKDARSGSPTAMEDGAQNETVDGSAPVTSVPSNMVKMTATPTGSPSQPRRPAPTARPRARGQAPPPPAAKRDSAQPAEKRDTAQPAEKRDAAQPAETTEPESKTETPQMSSDPLAAMAVGLKAAAKNSPKPSPKVPRKPPPARSLPQPPKKALPVPPQRKESNDENAESENTAENGETVGDGGCIPSLSGDFDSISPATMKKLGISAGRERVRLGTQGGLAGRRKPTRTHLRGADSGDELTGSDVDGLNDDSSSATDSPLVTRANRVAASDSPDVARAAVASSDKTPGTPRQERAATLPMKPSVSSSAVMDQQRRSQNGDDTGAIEEDDDEAGIRMRRAKTMTHGIELPLGGFLPPGQSPLKPSELRKAGNVAKPLRKAPAPTPPGRNPPPVPEIPEDETDSGLAEVNGLLTDLDVPVVVTPEVEEAGATTAAAGGGYRGTESQCASDDDCADSDGEGPRPGSSLDAPGGSHPVTSPSASSLTSPQHSSGESAGFSFSRENRRSGLRTAMDWSVEEVCNWLHLMDLPDISPVFSKFDVDGQKLLALDGAKMKAMGITNAGHVATLKKELKTMKAQVEKMMKDEKKRLEREAKADKKRRDEEAKLAKRNSKKRR